MNTTLNIAIAAEFELSEKIISQLTQSSLEISQVSVVEIYPFEEEQIIRFRRKSVEQITLDDVDWSKFNYVFFAGKLDQIAHIAQAAEQGCVVIDLLGVCSALADIPVVVPTINEHQLINLRQRNIVSLPDPQVSQLALALAPILQEINLTQVFVTSLLPASYTNRETVNKLAGQTARLLNGIPLEEHETRLAFDVSPHQFLNLSAQLQRIFPQLSQVIFHTIQVPVFYGLSQKVTAIAYDFDYQAQNSELVVIESQLLTPVLNGEHENNENEVKLHLSQINAVENGIEFWSVADEQRFNLALLGVKLLEGIYQQGY